MASKTIYSCDICGKEDINVNANGPIIVTVAIGTVAAPLSREFGNKGYHICLVCVENIQEKYQELVNAVAMLPEVKK